MIALLIFTARRDVMGGFVNSRLTNTVAVIGSAIVLALNTFLILDTFGVTVPGL